MKQLQSACRTLSALLLIAVLGLLPTFVHAAGSDVVLNIPSLQISTPIVEIKIVSLPSGEVTWDTRSLGMGIGHLEGTAWVSEPGNIVLGGHSELANRKPGIFYTLDQIQVGDPIELVQSAETRQYVVTQTYVVDIHDITPVYPTTNEQITLITCDIHSYDPATGAYGKRLIVVAERQS